MGKSMCKASCKSRGDLQKNQCWGTPRYVECLCNDGTSHNFPQCPCEASTCPSGPKVSPRPHPKPKPMLSGGTCVPNSDCDSNPWCKAPGYETWCEANKATCPHPQCLRAKPRCKAKLSI